jgi:hypothetical protein
MAVRYGGERGFESGEMPVSNCCNCPRPRSRTGGVSMCGCELWGTSSHPLQAGEIQPLVRVHPSQSPVGLKPRQRTATGCLVRVDHVGFVSGPAANRLRSSRTALSSCVQKRKGADRSVQVKGTEGPSKKQFCTNGPGPMTGRDGQRFG